MAPYIGNMSSPEPATSRPPADGPTAGGDEFDDLFDYDVGGADDPFADQLASKLINNNDAYGGVRAGAGLGIDEEVEVTKKPRVPRVKLDENRLLSQAGIPKLRKRAKDLKLKGKGHEYSDAARLLSFYQLWLDDLFPKAKFLDAAAMVEKLGHKRRMQIMRMDWINEGRPRSHVHEDSIFDEPALPIRETVADLVTEKRIAPIFQPAVAVERLKTPDINGDMDEDIYGVSPQAQRTRPVEQPKSIFGGGSASAAVPKESGAQPEDEEDDLDALLAEHEMEQESVRPVAVLGKQTNELHVAEPNFDDEMEAMADMDMW